METSASLESYNKSVLCRICMQNENNSVSIFNEVYLGDKTITIAEIISECTKYPVAHNDQLPQQICHACLDMAKNAHRFKKQTEEAYCQLKALYDITWLPKQEQGGSDSVMSVSTHTTHKYTQTEKTSVFLCEICPKKFFVESELRHHRNTSHIHDGKKCRVCGESFIHLGQLKIHLSTEHPSEGIRCDFRCYVCLREFTRKDHLKRHLIRVHKLVDMQLNITKVSLDEPEIENPPVLSSALNDYSSHWPDYREDFDKEPIAVDQKSQTFNATNPFSSEDEGLDQRDFNDIENEDVKQFVKAITTPEISIKAESSDISYNIPTDKHEKLRKFSRGSVGETTDQLEPEKSKFTLNEEVDKAEDVQGNILTSMFEDHHDGNNSSEESSNEDYEADYEYEQEGNNESVKNSKRIQNIKEEQLEEPTKAIKKCKNKNKKTLKSTRRSYGSSKNEDNRCKECNRTFTRYNHLLRHMLTHSDERPHVCNFCSKGFSRSDHLQKHIQSIHSEKNFKCDQCSSAYGRKDHLQRHIETRHNKDPNTQRPQFDCDMCEKKFTTKTYLAKHKLLHTDRLYACKHCAETFQEKELMKEHQKAVHTQPRNFLCNICGDSFQRNEYLKIHMRRHTGEKPYKCRFCEKGFPRSTDLKMHERYHMGHKPNLCNLCGKGFHRPYNLTIHMRTHTGEKPYKCNQCPQAFAQSNDLKAHIRRHTGERFRCDMCSAAFLQRYGLNAHLRTVHNIIVTSFTGRLRKTDQPIDGTEQLNPQSQPKFIDSATDISAGNIFPKEEVLEATELLQQQPAGLQTTQVVAIQEPSRTSLPSPPTVANEVASQPLYLGHNFINQNMQSIVSNTPTSPIDISSTHPSAQQMDAN